MQNVSNYVTNYEYEKLILGVWMDLSKAFDTIDHLILLDKCVIIFRLYFNKKTMLAFTTTSYGNVKCVVPQG